MIRKIFAVYDVKAEAYLQPFYANTRGEAIRSFTEVVNDKSHQFGKYPADYILFELGAYEDCSATFNMLNAPQNLGVGIEFLNAVISP